MTSNFIVDFSRLSDGYSASVQYIDESGKEYTFNASGETPEELYDNLVADGIMKLTDNTDVEEYDADVEDKLLEYYIALEEENEQLRDEVQFLQKQFDVVKKINQTQVDSLSKLKNENKELLEENDFIYTYAYALQEELDQKKENRPKKPIRYIQRPLWNYYNHI